MYYHYDQITKEYIGSSDLILDPLSTIENGTDTYLGPPAWATETVSPAVGTNEVAVIDVDADTWSAQDDFRGTVYYSIDGEEHVIADIGVTVPGDATLTLPAAIILERAKNDKRDEIRLAYTTASNVNISISGMEYDGGISSHMRLDIVKRLAESVASVNVTFYDAYNEARMLDLATADSVIQAVGLAAQTELATKQTKMLAIDAAVDLDAVAAVVW